MSTRLLAILLATALGLSACTGGSSSSAGKFQGEQQAVAEVVEDLQNASEEREADTICRDILATSLRDQIAATGSSCEKEIDKAVKDADTYDLEVQSVKVTGTTATARVKGPAGDDRDVIRTFQFAKQGTPPRWRATSFGS